MIEYLGQDNYLTYGKMYILVDRSGDKFKVINDLGNYGWYSMDNFKW